MIFLNKNNKMKNMLINKLADLDTYFLRLGDDGNKNEIDQILDILYEGKKLSTKIYDRSIKLIDEILKSNYSENKIKSKIKQLYNLCVNESLIEDVSIIDKAEEMLEDVKYKYNEIDTQINQFNKILADNLSSKSLNELELREIFFKKKDLIEEKQELLKSHENILRTESVGRKQQLIQDNQQISHATEQMRKNINVDEMGISAAYISEERNENKEFLNKVDNVKSIMNDFTYDENEEYENYLQMLNGDNECQSEEEISALTSDK